MNFNLEQSEITNHFSVLDAISAFCMAHRLDIKELQSSESALAVTAILSCGSTLECSLTVSGQITLTLHRARKKTGYLLIWHNRQWQIQTAAQSA